jgi:uncharacterized membrane protein YcjF (UPF0283 family)
MLCHLGLATTELLRLFGTADFVRIGLELGQLTVRFDLGGGERVFQVWNAVTMAGVPTDGIVWQLPAIISDDVDHRVVVELASHELHVSLDGLATTGSLQAPAKFKGELS